MGVGRDVVVVVRGGVAGTWCGGVVGGEGGATWCLVGMGQ